MGNYAQRITAKRVMEVGELDVLKGVREEAMRRSELVTFWKYRRETYIVQLWEKAISFAFGRVVRVRRMRGELTATGHVEGFYWFKIVLVWVFCLIFNTAL